MDSVSKSLKTILELAKEEVENGSMTIGEVAIMLHNAGWTNFIDIDKTKRLLKL